MNKALKESFYEANVKIEEEFESVEEAHLSNSPSDDARVTILDLKLEKSRIKTNKEKKENG